MMATRAAIVATVNVSIEFMGGVCVCVFVWGNGKGSEWIR